MAVLSGSEVKVADEVWIATALLHKQYPDRVDFTVEEIVRRAEQEGISETLRPGVYIHAQMHCVANRPPNPGRYRMLVETERGRRRLFRPGDSYHPDREGSKSVPQMEDIPKKYRPLLHWYEGWSKSDRAQHSRFDALLSLIGSGKDLWKDEHADEYVNRLREGWE